MAFQLLDCSIENDIAAAVLDVEQQVAQFTKAIIAEIDAFPSDTSTIDKATDIMDKMVRSGPSPVDDLLNTNIGIPAKNSSVLDDEERLEELGLILIKGIIYLAGGANIDEMRKLYFSLGANTDLFLSLVLSSNKFVVTQNLLSVKKLPSKPTWKLQEARELFNNYAIEAIYTASDGEKYVVVPTFLGVNISKSRAAADNNVSKDKVVTNIFWLRDIAQDSATIASLSQLEIVGDELSTALSGGKLSAVQPTSTSNARSAASVSTGKAISQIQLLIDRFSKVNEESREGLRSDILKSLNEAQSNWFLLQQKTRFYSGVIENPEDISEFLKKNKTSDVNYLFTQRRTVSGIKFGASAQDISAKIRQAMTISAGMASLSTLMVNRNKVIIETDVDSANGSLIRNFCGITQVSNFKTQSSLVTAIGCLEGSLQVVVPEAARSTPQVGYPCFDSPASILFRNTDWKLTLDTDGVIDALNKALEALTGTPGIKEVIRYVIRIIQSVRRDIDKTLDHYKNVVQNFVKDVERFLSEYMSFFGTVSLDSSILKCVVGLDIQTTLPLLNSLIPIIDDLRRKLKDTLAKLSSIIYDLINKVLCAPINLLNSFMTGVDNFLPDFCQSTKFKLPPEVEALLLELQRSFLMESGVAQAYSRDVLRINATVQALPLKLNQFQQSLVCDSNANSRFLKASKSQASYSLTVDKVAQIGGSIL